MIEFSNNVEHFGPPPWRHISPPMFFRVNGGEVRENTEALSWTELKDQYDGGPKPDPDVRVHVSQDGEAWFEITDDVDLLPNVQVRQVRIYGHDLSNPPEAWGPYRYLQLCEVLDGLSGKLMVGIADELMFVAALEEHHRWDLEEAQAEFVDRFEGEHEDLESYAMGRIDQGLETGFEARPGYTIGVDEVYWAQYYSVIEALDGSTFVYRVTSA